MEKGKDPIVKKISLIFLLLIATLALCACDNAVSSVDIILDANSEQTILETQWSGVGNPYVFENHNCLQDVELAERYAIASVEVFQAEIYEILTELMSDGYKLLKNKDIVYSSPNIFYCSTTSPSGIWILENKYFDGESHYHLIQISGNGNVISTIDLSSILNGSRYSQTLTYSNGKLCMVADSKDLIIIDEAGAIISSIALPEESMYPVTGNSGDIFVVQESNEGNRIYKLNNDFSELTLAFSSEKGSIFDGGNEYLMLLETPKGLYSLNLDGSAIPIVIWQECNISLNGLFSIKAINLGEYVLLTSEGIGVLSAADPSEIKAKTELCLATINPSRNLQKIVDRYNSENNKYYVRIIDYSSNGSYSLSDASMKLSTDIISGNMPDLICFKSISPYPYIRKGILADLTVFFDIDDEMDLNDIAILNAISSHGSIYLISGSFNLETLVGLYSNFGDRYGWTLSEYLEIEHKLTPEMEIIHNMTKESFLNSIASRYIRVAIDWELGRCNFESPEFITLLEAGNRIRETPEDPNNMSFGYGPVKVGEGSRVVSLSWVEDVWKLAYEEYMAGKQLSFIGWPTIDGSSGSDIHLIEPIGIVDQGENAAGCWEFVKFMIQNVKIEDNGLPVYMPLLRNEIDAAIQSKEIPLKMTITDGNRLLSLISATENVAIYDEVVLGIIRDESAAFFNGNKTASEVAKLIQSKVCLYIAEQS